MSLKNKIKMWSVSESGRSMVEMLGVLAIIGVLSIAGIAGYKFALNKFRANEIINELNARALSVSAQMLSATTPYESDEVIEDGFGNTLAVGYSAESAVSSQNPDYFEITINGIPSEVCTQILRDYENPIMIFVNEIRYNNDINLCTTESGTVDMGFIYRRDLGERETCSEKGYFGEGDFMCHCAGNTYIDPNNPNACLCPSGHVWSAKENTCVESICEEGEFESLSDGCVPCAGTTMYQVVKGDERRIALCEACGNRKYLHDYNWCVSMEECPIGKGYWGNGTTAKCYLCGQAGIPDPNVRESCNECSGMYLNQGSRYTYCINNITCLQNEFKTLTGGCKSCDTPDTVEIGRHADHLASCRACGNRSVKDNVWCVKTICSANEFMGSDGICYLCDTEKSIAVGENSGCESAICNRSIVNGMCQVKTCDTTNGAYVRLSDGSCHDCSQTAPFKVTQESECDACSPTRRIVEGSGSKLCMLEGLCTKGVNYPEHYGKQCNRCTSSNAACAKGEFGREYCEGCGNHHYVENFCINNDACTKGSEFRSPNWSYSICKNCNLSGGISIGTHDLEREMCLACQAPNTRFWNGSVCYPCNIADTFSVVTDDEIASCKNCSERDVVDGQCILKQ